LFDVRVEEAFAENALANHAGCSEEDYGHAPDAIAKEMMLAACRERAAVHALCICLGFGI
jgi:hypothetical protein